MSFLEWGTQNWTLLKMWPNQAWLQYDCIPATADYTISDTSQGAIDLLGHLGMLLARVQSNINQHPQFFFPLHSFPGQFLSSSFDFR